MLGGRRGALSELSDEVAPMVNRFGSPTVFLRLGRSWHKAMFFRVQQPCQFSFRVELLYLVLVILWTLLGFGVAFTALTGRIPRSLAVSGGVILGGR